MRVSQGSCESYWKLEASEIISCRAGHGWGWGEGSVSELMCLWGWSRVSGSRDVREHPVLLRKSHVNAARLSPIIWHLGVFGRGLGRGCRREGWGGGQGTAREGEGEGEGMVAGKRREVEKREGRRIEWDIGRRGKEEAEENLARGENMEESSKEEEEGGRNERSTRE